MDRLMTGFAWALLAVTVELWAFRLACFGALVVLALGMFVGGREGGR